MPFCPICYRHHDPDIGCTDATGQAIRDMGLPRAVHRPEDSVSPNAGRHYKRATVRVLAISGVFLLIIWLLRGVSCRGPVRDDGGTTSNSGTVTQGDPPSQELSPAAKARSISGTIYMRTRSKSPCMCKSCANSPRNQS